jgi:hypothetical protein
VSVRSFEREFTDGNGVVIRVRVDLDEGVLMEREILRLANKARASSGRAQALVRGGTLRYATSAGGAFRVTVLAKSG